jgi:DNA-binding CsgD family transcriptional regulator
VRRVELWEEGVGGRAEDEGRERNPTRPGDVPDSRRIVEDGRSSGATDVTPDAQDLMVKRDASSWVNWQSGFCLLALGVVCVLLAPITSLWWLVVLCVAAVPIVLTIVPSVLETPGRRSKGLDKKGKERELLGALAERGDLTPATAAMRTSLTVEEASKMMDELTGKGYLKLQAGDGVIAYALRERGRPPALGKVSAPFEPGLEDVGAPKRFNDPLSERELEVLALLASGRTNAEIAKDLFVALGTVKSHLNNIYRKLEATNRAEAVTRARKINLLR